MGIENCHVIQSGKLWETPSPLSRFGLAISQRAGLYPALPAASAVRLLLHLGWLDCMPKPGNSFSPKFWTVLPLEIVLEILGWLCIRHRIAVSAWCPSWTFRYASYILNNANDVERDEFILELCRLGYHLDQPNKEDPRPFREGFLPVVSRAILHVPWGFLSLNDDSKNEPSQSERLTPFIGYCRSPHAFVSSRSSIYPSPKDEKNVGALFQRCLREVLRNGNQHSIWELLFTAHYFGDQYQIIKRLSKLPREDGFCPSVDVWTHKCSEFVLPRIKLALTPSSTVSILVHFFRCFEKRIAPLETKMQKSLCFLRTEWFKERESHSRRNELMTWW